jgi:hypothetical protein
MGSTVEHRALRPRGLKTMRERLGISAQGELCPEPPTDAVQHPPIVNAGSPGSCSTAWCNCGLALDASRRRHSVGTPTRPPTAALSGHAHKAPGCAGGPLLRPFDPDICPASHIGRMQMSESRLWRPSSRKIEAIGIHHFGPGCDEVADELAGVVILSIDLGIGPQD